MKDISLVKNKFVALWVETTLWGVFTVLFAICVYVLLYSKQARIAKRVNGPLLGTAVTMYLLCTAHVVNDFVRAMVGFVDYESKGGAAAYYKQIWIWSYVLREALYVTHNLVADSLLIYRLYVVWDRDRRVVLGPIILVIASAVCGYLAVWGFSQVNPGETNHSVKIYPWGVALFSLSLFTNVIVTGSTAFRIWWTGRRLAQTLERKHGRKYNRAMVIIVESGAMCSIATLVVLITYTAKTNANDIAFDSLAQILGIGPTLIIVRVGLGISIEGGTSYYSSTLRTASRGRRPVVDNAIAIQMGNHNVSQGDTNSSYENVAQSPKFATPGQLEGV